MCLSPRAVTCQESNSICYSKIYTLFVKKRKRKQKTNTSLSESFKRLGPNHYLTTNTSDQVMLSRRDATLVALAADSRWLQVTLAFLATRLKVRQRWWSCRIWVLFFHRFWDNNAPRHAVVTAKKKWRLGVSGRKWGGAELLLLYIHRYVYVFVFVMTITLLWFVNSSHWTRTVKDDAECTWSARSSSTMDDVMTPLWNNRRRKDGFQVHRRSLWEPTDERFVKSSAYNIFALGFIFCQLGNIHSLH